MEAPKIPSFFKTKGPKQFGFRPRFYNADKEEREKRNKLIKAEADFENKQTNPEFQSKIRERWQHLHQGTNRRTTSNYRLIVIILALLGVTYLLLK